jgi:uncharacterized cofD-like protein
LANALVALRQYAAQITAVVSVADDGGSSGRLRRDLDVPAPGDLRRCLVALASTDSPWPAAFEMRFKAGELRDHALGNLLLVGLAETLGDLTAALDEAGRVLGCVGRVLPATLQLVSLTAEVGGTRVTGQVKIAEAGEWGRIRKVALTPPDAPACADALEAIADADQIVLAPGSLFTSTVAVFCVPQIRDALEGARAPVVMVANVATEGETTGLDGTEHLRAVLDHGGRVDQFLYDPDAGLAVDPAAVKDLGVEPVAAHIVRRDGSGHVAERLANALAGLV